MSTSLKTVTVGLLSLARPCGKGHQKKYRLMRTDISIHPSIHPSVSAAAKEVAKGGDTVSSCVTFSDVRVETAGVHWRGVGCLPCDHCNVHGNSSYLCGGCLRPCTFSFVVHSSGLQTWGHDRLIWGRGAFPRPIQNWTRTELVRRRKAARYFEGPRLLIALCLGPRVQRAWRSTSLQDGLL